jgi:hypothetical protein
MIALFQMLDSFFGNSIVLMIITIVSTLLKFYFLGQLSLKRPQTKLSKLPWIFITLVLISAIVIDFAWIVLLADPLFITNMPYPVWLFPVRLSWGFFTLQYQAFMLFIESLIASRFTFRHKICIAISSFFFVFSVGLAFVDINCQSAADRPHIEFLMRTAGTLYLLLILVPSSLLVTVWKLRTKNFPRILKQQLKIFIPALIVPLWILDMFQVFPLSFFSPTFTTNSFSAATFTTLLITCAVFYCARRVMALRFLNIKGHVQSRAQFNFIDGFKDVLEQLGHATSKHYLKKLLRYRLIKQNYISAKPPNRIKIPSWCTMVGISARSWRTF